MRTRQVLFSLTLLACLLLGHQSVHAQDIPGSRDPDGLPRMPVYQIEAYEVEEQGAYLFDLDEDESKTIEGKKTYIEYAVKPGAKRPTKTEIFTYYFKKVEEIGGKVPFEDLNDNMATLHYQRGGKDKWCALSIFDEGATVTLTLIEP
jgi:hypothetical protein